VPTDWAAVYRATYADLVRFLYRKVWETDRAQDLAQEVFVRALDHDPDNPRAFVFTVAANLARDEARSAVRQRRHLLLIRGEPPLAPPAPDQELERKERERVVQRALEQLSDRDREVLLLWDAGFDYQEIAAQTGLARGAVGTTLSRARRRLVEVHAAMEGHDAALG
jgi:RNA polymerase sigma-70 factor (ECF subfamily)